MSKEPSQPAGVAVSPVVWEKDVGGICCPRTFAGYGSCLSGRYKDVRMEWGQPKALRRMRKIRDLRFPRDPQYQ